MSMIGNYLRLPEVELERFVSDPPSIMDFLYEEDSDFSEDQQLDIDKAWHLIHFLLTGTAWEGKVPLRNAVLGGAEVGDVDVGYGPARYLRPLEVRELSAALADLSPEILWQNLDWEAVRENEIYPTEWTGNETERTYTLHHLQAMTHFFQQAADSGEAVLLYLN